MKNHHIFNPEHDLALANCTTSFKAPEAALSMSHDLSLLPAWYAEEGDIIVSDLDINQIEDGGLLPPLDVQLTLDNVTKQCDVVFPWGWDQCVAKFLQLSSVPIDHLPTTEELQSIRQLSNRQTASMAMEYISSKAKSTNITTPPALIFHSIEQIETFASTNAEIVLKSPWSSSGKGVFWSKGKLTASIKGWCQRTLDKQKTVIGEIAYEKVQDFALEFHIDNDKNVTFRGYSLFFTERAGIYRGNRLLTNQAIEQELSQWVNIEHIHEVRDLWIDFIKEHVVDGYHGYLGVDMLIYKEGDTHKINPAIELNLRMTMGILTRIFYDKYIVDGAEGWFSIDHMTPSELKATHLEQKKKHPLKIEDGKIQSGYISLCPICENTEYKATIIVN